MSDTPRTDAEAKDGWMPEVELVSADFCRTLERENAVMRTGLAEAYKIIDVLYKDALANNEEGWPRAREWMDLWKEVVP